MSQALLAAQLFTVREFIKTPAEIAVALRKIRDMGYDGVQLSCLGPIDSRELRKIADGEGLIICSDRLL